MKKIKMARGTTLTFEEGCNKYLENCRQRNLREGRIYRYKQRRTQHYEFSQSNVISDKTYAGWYLCIVYRMCYCYSTYCPDLDVFFVFCCFSR